MGLLSALLKRKTEAEQKSQQRENQHRASDPARFAGMETLEPRLLLSADPMLGQLEMTQHDSDQVTQLQLDPGSLTLDDGWEIESMGSLALDGAGDIGTVEGDFAPELTEEQILTHAKSQAYNDILQDANTFAEHGRPYLPEMYAVDEANLQGQVIFLNFEGGSALDYFGPESVTGFDQARFEVNGDYGITRDQAITGLVNSLNNVFFTNTGLIFTTTEPSTGEYSTIHIGGNNDAFAHLGDYESVAEKIDINNADPSDSAFVFTDELPDASNSMEYLYNVGKVTAHAVGQLLGFADIGQFVSADQPQTMDDVATTGLATGISTENYNAQTGQLLTDAEKADLLFEQIIDEAEAVTSTGELFLQDMYRVDPTVTNWTGQVVFLNFDGATDVDYHGPQGATLENIDLAGYAAPTYLNADRQELIDRTVQHLNDLFFKNSGIVFTTTQPTSGEYSTIHIGDTDDAFASLGEYFGIAEDLDIGNDNFSDNAFVFAAEIPEGARNVNEYTFALAKMIGHELGRLLGYAAHDEQITVDSVITLDDVDMDKDHVEVDGDRTSSDSGSFYVETNDYVYFEAKFTDYWGGGDGGVNMSFPYFDGSYSSRSWTGDSGSSRFYPGSTLWHKNGYQITSSDLMVEGYENNWNTYGWESETLETRLRMNSSYDSFDFFVRGWVGTDFDPSSGSNDQQGYDIYKYDIYAQDPPDPPDLDADINANPEPWTWGQHNVYADIDIDNDGDLDADNVDVYLLLSTNSTITTGDYQIKKWDNVDIDGGDDWTTRYTWDLPDSPYSGFNWSDDIYVGVWVESASGETNTGNNSDDDSVSVSPPAPGTPGTPDLSSSDDSGDSSSDDITNQTSNLTFSWSSASGNVERYYYGWNDSTPSSSYTTGTSVSVSAPGTGNQTFYVRAWNSGGYGSSRGKTITIDTSGPGDPSVNLSSSWTTDSTPPVSWSASDSSGIWGYWWSVNDSSWDDTNWTWTDNTSMNIPSQSTGEHTFRIFAVDGAGNWGSTESSTFRIDRTDPNTPVVYGPGTLDSGSPEIISNQNPRLDWNNTSDSGSGVSYYEVQLQHYNEFFVWWDHTNTTTGNSYYDTSTLVEDEYRFRVTAVDAVGNKSNESAWVYFNVDPAKPDLAASNPSVNSLSLYAGDQFTFSVDVDNDGGATAPAGYIYYYLNEGSSASYSSGDKIGEDYYGSISPGGHSDQSFSYILPSNLNPGTYTFSYEVDATDTADPEENENNNRYYFNITILDRPDLKVTQMAADDNWWNDLWSGQDWLWGEQGQVDISVKNEGGANASGVTIQLIASNDTTVGDADDYIIQQWTNQTINAGNTWSRTDYNWDLPRTPYANMPSNGTMYLIAWAVPVANESDTIDNGLYTDVTMIEAFNPQFSDVSESGWVDNDADSYVRQFDFDFSVSSNVSGEYLIELYDEYGNYIGNTGYQGVNGSDTSDIRFDASDFSTYDGNFRSSTVDFTAILYDTTDRGNWRVVTTWDRDNDNTLGWKSVESDGQDSYNPQISSAWVTKYDDRDGDGHATRLTVNYTVDSDWAGDYYARIYKDIVPYTTVGDNLLTTTSTSSISTGGSNNHSFTFHTDDYNSSWFDHGTHTFQIQLVSAHNDNVTSDVTQSDFSGLGSVETELDAEDQTNLVAGTIRYDSATAQEWENFWVEVDIDNVGQGHANASKVQGYLSLESDGSPTSYYLGQQDVTALNPGSSDTVRWEFTMPNLDDGNYTVYLVVEVDSENDVYEGASEANNTFVATNGFSVIDPDFEPVIDSIAIVDKVDQDNDGYARQFEVRVDVDAGVTSGQAKLAFYRDVEFWFDNPLGTTAAIDVSGTTDDPSDWVINSDVRGLSYGTYDIRIDLLDAATDDVIATYKKGDFAALGGIQAETALEDTPLDLSFADVYVDPADMRDDDGDGYADRFRMIFDVNSNKDADYNIEVYDAVLGGLPIATAGSFGVNGNEVDYNGVWIDIDPARYGDSTRTARDFEIMVYDGNWNHHQTWRAGDDGSLNDIQIESQYQDDNFDPEVDTASVDSAASVDVDVDGHYSTVTVEFDVDSPISGTAIPGDYYVKLFADNFDFGTGLFDELLATSGTFSVNGSTNSDSQSISFTVPGDWSNGTVDLRIDVFNAYTDVKTDSFTVSNVKVEPASSDIAQTTELLGLGNVTSSKGTPVLLEVTLQAAADGTKLMNGQIDFEIYRDGSWQAISNDDLTMTSLTTDSDGVASVYMLIPETWDAGSYNVRANFTGNAAWASTSATATLTVNNPWWNGHHLHSHTTPGGGIPLVLVHGNGSEGADTQGWDRFMEYVNANAEAFAAFDIYSWQHDSSRAVGYNGTTGNAADLADYLYNELLPNYSAGTKPLLMAHSRGGLVSRAFMDYNNQGDDVLGLVTLGTPHHGSPLAVPDWNAVAWALQVGTGSVERTAFNQLVGPNGVFDTDRMGDLTMAWDNQDGAVGADVTATFDVDIANGGTVELSQRDMNVPISTSDQTLFYSDLYKTTFGTLSDLNASPSYLNNIVTFAAYDNDLGDNPQLNNAWDLIWNLGNSWFDDHHALETITGLLAGGISDTAANGVNFFANDGLVPIQSALLSDIAGGASFASMNGDAVNLNWTNINDRQQVKDQHIFIADHLDLIDFDIEHNYWDTLTSELADFIEHAELEMTAWDGPDVVVTEGGTYAISATIENTGDFGAGASHAKAWLSTTPGGTDHYIGEVTVAALGSNASTNVTWNGTMPSLASGVYEVYVTFEVDSRGEVFEGFPEANNFYQTSTGFDAQDNLFDASIVDVYISNFNDQDGDNYARSFDLNFDADSNITGDVKLSVFVDGLFSDTWIADSSVVTLNGADNAYHSVTIDASAANLSHGTRDFVVKLYNNTTGELLDTVSAWGDGDLNNIRTELASQDQPFAPYFYNARIGSVVDYDGDGHARRFDVEFDVDSNIAGDYYVKVYQSGQTSALATSSTFSVNGYASDYRSVQIDADALNWSHGTVDLTLELYSAADNSLAQTVTHTMDPSLNDVPVELAAQDQPFEPVINQITVSGTDANSNGYFSTVDLEFQVGAQVGSGDYYVKVYDWATRTPLATSATSSASYGSTDTLTVSFNADTFGFQQYLRNLKVELYNASDHSLVRTLTHSSNSALGNVGIESSQQDMPILEPGDTMNDAEDLGTISSGSTESLATGSGLNIFLGDGENGDRDVDIYEFRVSEAGMISVDVDAVSIGLSNIDAYLRLFDSAGNEIDYNDDHTNNDPYLETSVAAGTYFVGVSSREGRFYSPNVAGSANATSNTGEYEMELSFQASAPIIGGEVVVNEYITLYGDFSVTSGAINTAVGEISVNNILTVHGSVSYNNDLEVWGNGEVWIEDVPVLGDLQLYEGEFDFNASDLITDVFNSYASALSVVGMDVEASSIRLVQDGVQVRGSIGLPDLAGGIELDIDGSHFVEVNTATGAITYDMNLAIPQVDLSFGGLGFEADNAEIYLSNTSGTAEGVLTGTFNLALPPVVDSVEVNLSKTDGNYFLLNADGDVELVGAISAGRIDIAPGLYVDSLLVELDTVNDRYYGSGMIGLPIGSGVEVGGSIEFIDGHLNEIGLIGENLNIPVWAVPPVNLQRAGGTVSGIYTGPLVISPELGLTAGPQIAGYSLLRIDGSVDIDLSGRVDGQVSVKVGNVDDPLAMGSMRLIWDQSYGVYLAGDLSAGYIDGDPVFSLNGQAALDNYNNFQGRLNGTAVIPHTAPIIGSILGGQGVSTTTYMQAYDDADQTNDYLIGSVMVDLPIFGEVEHAIELNLNDGKIDWNASLDRVKEVTFPGVELSDMIGFDASIPEPFAVASGVEFVIFRASWETGDTDLTIVDPVSGATITPDNVGDYANIEYIKSDDINEAYYIVTDPAAGEWQLSLTETIGIGNYNLEHYQQSDAPKITMLSPAQPTAGSPVTLSWVDADSDSEASISLFYDTDRSGADGTLITSGILQSAGDSYDWDTTGVAAGEYYVYAVISDGDHAPAISYAPGMITVTNPDAPAQVTGVTVVESTDTSATLNWNAAVEADLDHYNVRYTAEASGDTYEFAVNTVDPQVTLNNLVTGETYRVTVTAVDTDGNVSAMSTPTLVIVGAEQTVAPETDQWDVYATPGETYTAKVPGEPGDFYNALTLPNGAAVDANGIFTWAVPDSGVEGWHEVLVHVTDVDGEVEVQRFFLLVDTQAPQWITDTATVDSADSTSITLTAPLVEEASGVLQYRLMRNGQAIGDWQASATFVDTGLNPDTQYSYEIMVRDASPDRMTSTWTTAISAQTHAAAPASIVVGGMTDTTATLQQINAAANPATTTYALMNVTTGQYVAADGSASASAVWQTRTQWQGTVIAGLEADTDYSFTAMARNADGVTTDQSPQATIHTLREAIAPTLIDSSIHHSSGNITLTFSEAVNLSLKDVVILDTDGNVVDTTGATMQITPGSPVVKLVLNTALADGRYDLQLNALSVQDLSGNLLDGDGDGTAGDDYTLSFHKLVGDIDGDGRVNVMDLLHFRHAWLTQPGDANYDARVDLDDSGERISVMDLLLFRANWLKQV